MPRLGQRGSVAAVRFGHGWTGFSRLGVGRRLLGFVCRRPLDSVGLLLAAVASFAILVNALYLQTRSHPAPMFQSKLRAPADESRPSAGPVLPRARPGERDAKVEPPAPPRGRAQAISEIQRELSRRGYYDGPMDGLYGPRTDAAIREFVQAAGLKTAVEPDEALLRAIQQAPQHVAAPAAASQGGRRPDPIGALLAARRIVALQRALADFGYGPVAPTGVVDAQTRAAIERFERERRLPVTGQFSERIARELAAVTGRPLD